MSDSPPFDLARAHRWFSADCFNRVWTLLDKPDRTPDDSERMISLAHASLAHWRERADCTPQNLSIGYWQVSRVYAVLGQAENARHYGQLCLDVSGTEPPFLLGYAHEALARAERLAGNTTSSQQHLAEARRLAALVADTEERRALENDLATLAGG
jgi:hypothetical protein